MKKPTLKLSVNLFLLCTLTLFLLGGCSSVKRYKSASWKGEDNSLVNMELFGARLEQAALSSQDRNLWDLSAGAQTQLIQILNERYPRNEHFMATLSKRYLDEGSAGPLDLTRKDLKMVFTISKKRDYQLLNESSARFSPADRIEYLMFSLEIPPENNLRFTGWNRYSTEYGEIEIADVSFSTSLDLEVDGTVKESDGGTKTSFNRNEQQELRARYLKLNGSISDEVLRVEEEGTREIDLTGNVIADVSLEFAGFPERLFIPRFTQESDQHGGEASLSGFRFVEVLVPRLEEAPDSLMANLTFEYVYRHVQAGGKTFAEWDDQVEYYTGRVKKQIPLFLKRDYLPAFYCIASEEDPNRRLKIASGSGSEYLLQFLNYQDANRVVDCFMRKNRSSASETSGIGDVKFLFDGSELTQQQASLLDWKVIPVY